MLIKSLQLPHERLLRGLREWVDGRIKLSDGVGVNAKYIYTRRKRTHVFSDSSVGELWVVFRVMVSMEWRCSKNREHTCGKVWRSSDNGWRDGRTVCVVIDNYDVQQLPTHFVVVH